MELVFYYTTNYSLDLCLEYMKHDNIYDRFKYEWEEKGDYYLITFIEYKNSMLSLANAPKPTFKVTFENMGNQTGITVQFIKGKGFLWSLPFVSEKDVDIFWEKKLDAKKYREYREGFMKLKKRKEYVIFTIIFFSIGFSVFGGMTIVCRELLDIQWNAFCVTLVCGLVGGWLLGGLASGIILFSNFFRDQKLFIKIILCIFFPITFILICQIGILSFIPYEIYNFICIKRKTEN